MIHLKITLEPFIEKVQETKDLKPIRKAEWFLKLCTLDEETVSIKQIETLQNEICLSNIGGKKVRTDAFRRLEFIKLGIIQEVQFLGDMCCIYPGDPDGSISKDICRLMGNEWKEPEIIVKYE
ncbi:hypothetical protein [Caulobacter phage Cr30]|uniref:hypothetical protein n=1 Tax=Caulobacter phage Cr30 TaxID=1357714 RepID=UPI0004A9B51A|nr:hypothetical protein OZ74_gp219 [Caulobacter phage Cr30]AGS81124.1 hypothetical protein [Caulobacter phage Cr30]